MSPSSSAQILRPSFTVPEDWSPGRIRRELIAAVVGVAGSRTGLTYSLIQDGREARMCEMTPRGGSEFVTIVNATDGVPYSVAASLDPCSRDYAAAFADDPNVSLAGFVIVRAGDNGTRRLVSEFWRPHLIKAALGMTALHSGRILGWIGAYRHDDEADFTAADKAALQAYSEIVTSRLALASQRASALFPDLESFAVFSGRGTLQHLTAAMDRWCSDGTNIELLTAAVRRFADEDRPEGRAFIGRGRVNLHRLAAEDSEDQILVKVIEGVHPQTPVGVRLTPALRKVADLAVLGTTVPEIARSLDKSPNTVRVQLKDIYQRLGLASRIELVQLMGNHSFGPHEHEPGEAN